MTEAQQLLREAQHHTRLAEKHAMTARAEQRAAAECIREAERLTQEAPCRP